MTIREAIDRGIYSVRRATWNHSARLQLIPDGPWAHLYDWVSTGSHDPQPVLLTELLKENCTDYEAVQPAAGRSSLPEGKTESWAVTVERNGEEIVTVASNHLSGRQMSDEDVRIVKVAAVHLASFIGLPQAAAAVDPQATDSGKATTRVACSCSSELTSLQSQLTHVRALVEQWDDDAKKWEDGLGDNLRSRMLNRCARQLTAILSPEGAGQ